MLTYDGGRFCVLKKATRAKRDASVGVSDRRAFKDGFSFEENKK